MTDRSSEDQLAGSPDWAGSSLEPIRRAILAAAWTGKFGKPLDLPVVAAAAVASRFLPARPASQLDPRRPVRGTSGFVAICPDLEPETLLEGYRSGLHQVSHVMPPKWWSRDRRMVMFFDAVKIEKNLRRKLRQGKFTVTFDTAFARVVSACAAPRNGALSLTWLLPPVMHAFKRLHDLGHAHSVEVWNERGELVGGLFGVAFGSVFITESQFNIERDMAKVAFVALNRHLQAWRFAFNDVGPGTPHLAAAGGEYLERDAYLDLVARFGQGEHRPGRWAAEPDLAKGDWEPAAGDGLTRSAILRAG